MVADMHTLEDAPDALARVLDWWRWAMRGTMEWAHVSLLCRRAAGEAFDAAGAPLFLAPGTTPRGLLQISEELQLLADIAAQHHVDSLPPTQMHNLIPTEISL